MSPRLGLVRLRLFHLMANNPSKATNDDFLKQILGLLSFASTEAGLTDADGGLGGSGTSPPPMMLQLKAMLDCLLAATTTKRPKIL